MTDEAKVLCEPFKFKAEEKNAAIISNGISDNKVLSRRKTAAATIRSLRVCVRKTLTDPRLALTLSNAFCDELEH